MIQSLNTLYEQPSNIGGMGFRILILVIPYCDNGASYSLVRKRGFPITDPQIYEELPPQHLYLHPSQSKS